MAKRRSKKIKIKKNALKNLIIASLAIIAVLVIALLVLYIIKPQIVINIFNAAERFYYQNVSIYFNDSGDDDPEGHNGATATITPQGDLAEISSADLSIHFLELGNKYTGDSTLIKVGENTEVLIDAGSRKSSATTIKSYVDQYCTDGVLEYVIATHAHQDHIAGFVGTGSGSEKTGILYQYQVETLIQFSMHNTTSAIYNNYVDAVNYCRDNGTTVYDAKQCWNQTDGATRTYYLDEEQKISLNVLYNYYYFNETEDENDYSVCVLLSQELENGNKNHYLFTGDLEGKGEDYLVDNNTLPEVVLYKGGHHGSKTSSTDKLLDVIKPQKVAVCCCAGATEYTDNNENTFPTQAFIDRVSKHTTEIYATTLCTDYDNNNFESLNGNIVFYYVSDGENRGLKLWCSNNTTILKETDWFKANRTWPQ